MVCIKIKGKAFVRAARYIYVCGDSQLAQVSFAVNICHILCLSSGFLPDYKQRLSNEILFLLYI